MTWEEEARALPAPSAEEIEDWADGIVCHLTSDGVRLFFDPKERRWLRAGEPPDTE